MQFSEDKLKQVLANTFEIGSETFLSSAGVKYTLGSISEFKKTQE